MWYDTRVILAYISPRLAKSLLSKIDSVCLSVPLSVALLQIASFLFLDKIKPFFRCQFSMWHSTKRCSSIFDLGAVTPKIYSPKFCTKSTITRLLWQMGQPGGFRGWTIQWNHAKCCGADPCCHGNEIWARCGDPNAYRLVCMVYTDIA